MPFMASTGPTTSGINACDAGSSKLFMAPATASKAMTGHADSMPPTATTPRVSVVKPLATAVPAST